MTLLGTLEDGRLVSSVAVLGPASYATGAKPTIVFTDFAETVEAILSIRGSLGRIAEQSGVLAARTLTYLVRGTDVQQIASGTVTPVAGTTTVVTGIGRALTSAVASLKGAVSLTHYQTTVSIGDQAGAPAAGSIILTHTKPTTNANVTPIPATTPWGAVDWVAYAADDGAGEAEVADTTDLSAETYTAVAIGR